MNLCGKSYYTKKLAEYFNLPIINKKNLIRYFENKDSELGEELR